MAPVVSNFALGALACLVNVSSLLFNLGLTQSDAINALDPNVFSDHGQRMLLVWGVAYYCAGCDEGSSSIWFAFALEKAVYVAQWISWHSAHDIMEVWSAAVNSSGSAPPVGGWRIAVNDLINRLESIVN